MTGYFVRVLRDGSWQNIEIEHLTGEEFDSFAAKRPDRGWTWAKALAKWIRENVRQMDIDDVVKPRELPESPVNPP